VSRRGAGAAFIGFATFLFSTRFIAAALYSGGGPSWSSELFASMLQYVDRGLTTASVICVAVGAAYLLWAEIADIRAD
jgi:mannose/fructose/N-acetylgalactosamine-specific phosphotransferase system component IIC